MFDIKHQHFSVNTTIHYMEIIPGVPQATDAAWFYMQTHRDDNRQNV